MSSHVAIHLHNTDDDAQAMQEELRDIQVNM